MRYFSFILRFILFLLTVVAVVALCFATLSLYLDPVSFSWFALLGLGFEWLLLANLALLVCWLFTHHRRYAFLPLAALLLSAPAISNTIGMSKVKVPANATHSLTLLTYNTHQLGNITSSDPADNAVLRYIKQTDADVVCLQEFETYKTARKAPTLQGVKDYLEYPYQYIDFKVYKGNRQYGTAVFSKYPLIEKQTLHYESKTNQSDRCLILVDGDTLCLINNHLQSFQFTKDNLDLSQNMGSDEIKQKTAGIIGKMRLGYKYRAPQARFVRDEIRKNTAGRIVVCGDFNDTPVSYTYHTVSKHLRDCYLQTSPFSLGHTFMHGRLGIRIDYVLCSKNLYPVSSEVPSVTHSDHYPLIVKLVW